MSRSDLDRWDRKYRARTHPASARPDPLLVRHESLFDGRGRALDVACGTGAGAVFLAERGYRTLGVDGSVEGLRMAGVAAQRAGVTLDLLAVDLDGWRPPRASFRAIVVFRFLDRALLEPLVDALEPGGVLLYATFNVNHLTTHPRFARAYVLEPGELARRLGEDLDVIATNDGPDIEEPLTWLAGRRP